MKSNKFWICVLSAILLASVITAFMFKRGPASEARVYLDGDLIEILDLSNVTEPYSFIIESVTGTNTISVENGRIRVSDADCPDGACIRQGWIRGGATPIVCLPHKLVIELANTELPEVDAVAH